MAFPFSSGKMMIDYVILRLETYPQDGGTRPKITPLSPFSRSLVKYLARSYPAIFAVSLECIKKSALPHC